MKIYDFDKVIERRGSGAVKTDALKNVFGNEEAIPMWVADMDFETPDFIINAIRKRMEHAIFGYTVEPEDFRQAIIDWITDHHGWTALMTMRGSPSAVRFRYLQTRRSRGLPMCLRSRASTTVSISS